MRKSVFIGKGKVLPMALLVVALVAVGAGAAAGTILAGKVTGEVPVAVSQALLAGVPENDDPGAGDTDMPQQVYDNVGLISVANRFIGAKSDDNTGFQAAMELAVGDWTEIQLPLKNASENNLYGELTLNVPAGLEVEVWTDNAGASRVTSIVRTGLNTWKFIVEADALYVKATDSLHVVVSVDDDAPPGYYSISGNIKQIPY